MRCFGLTVRNWHPTLQLPSGWMLKEEYKNAVAANVQRLGIKRMRGRYAPDLRTQRPDVNVMPMQLRDNLGNRLVLRVASIGTAEIALGVKGAESLLGRGHLAARLNGEHGTVFAQAPFLSDEDIVRAVDAIIRGDHASAPNRTAQDEGPIG